MKLNLRDLSVGPGFPARMEKFIRYYRFSSGLFMVLMVLAGLGSIGAGEFLMVPVAIVLTAIARLPRWRAGGIASNRRLAIVISIGFTVLLVTGAILLFLEFLETQGEGPKGEGSPLAFIIAMVMFALVYLCPWLLTALRGIGLWNVPVIYPRGWDIDAPPGLPKMTVDMETGNH